MTRSRRRRALSCEGLETRQLLSTGYFYIVNAQSGKVLDANYPVQQGAIVEQYQLNGEADQKWSLDPTGTGTIQSVNNGFVLTDPGYLSPAQIRQYANYGWADQQWYFAKVSANTYAIVNAYSHEVLDDPSGSTANYVPVQQYPWNGGANQQWILIGAKLAVTQQHYVSSYVGGNFMAEPPGTTANNHRFVEQDYFDGASNQLWDFIPLADGYSMIVNAESGMALDDPGSSTTSGQAMQVYQVNGGLNQQWQTLRPFGNDYEFQNVASGLFLTDPYSSTQPGVDVIQDYWRGGTEPQPNQLWVLW
jgi:hypothetical protein